MQNAENFVADKVFPNVSVAKQSDAYFTYDRGDFNRDEMKDRAPGAESAGGTYAIGRDTYYATTFAYHRDIPDPVRANADDPISLDREATLYVSNKALIKREVTWRESYFMPSNPGAIWTFVVNGASARTDPGAFDPTDASNTNNNVQTWSDNASTPIEDIRQGKRYVLESTGFMPNVLTIGRTVFDLLLDHPDIVGRLDRGQTVGPAQANKDSLAALFGVEQVLVMDAIQNTAAEGIADSHSFIGGEHALLSYRPAAAGIMTPSAGYTFNWTGLVGSTGGGMRIKRMRAELIASDRIEIEMSYDQKKVSADMGYFFNNIVA
jgi:hypothetical protein